MSVDVFGRVLNKEKSVRGPPGIGFNLTETGDYNIENKLLRQVADAVDKYDAVNLNTLSEKLAVESYALIREFEPILSDFKAKLDSLETTVASFDEKIINIKSTVDGFNEKINKVETSVTNLRRRVNKINKTNNKVDPRLVEIEDNATNQRSLS